MKTLGAALNPKRNSLNALRLLLATAVIVSHAPLVGGFGAPFKFGDLEIGGWAVGGFFAISGWLITGSRLRLGIVAFMWRRALRLYPAFWVALIVVAFGFGPLVTLIRGTTYPLYGAIAYVLGNFTLEITHPVIGSTLEGTFHEGIWNLSLWTLRWEFLCYLGIALLLSIPWVRRNRWIVVPVWVAISIPYAVVVFQGDPLSTGLAQGSRLGGYFLAGALAYLYKDKIPASAPLAALSTITILGLALLGVGGPFGAAPLTYLSIWLGCTLPLTWVGRRNDISYGVYIYAFPMQILLTALGVTRAGLMIYTICGIVSVIPLAWISWRLVERPSLRLKSLIPERWPMTYNLEPKTMPAPE